MAKFERTLFYKDHPDIEQLSEQQVGDIRREVHIIVLSKSTQ